MSNKNQPSVQLTHAGYNVRVVLDRKRIAYPIWGAPTLLGQMRGLFGNVEFKQPSRKLPSERVRSSFQTTFDKAARSLGAKGWVRI